MDDFLKHDGWTRKDSKLTADGVTAAALTVLADLHTTNDERSGRLLARLVNVADIIRQKQRRA